MKLNIKAFGLALGIVWAVGVMIMGIIVMIFQNYGAGFVDALGSLYIGYKATVLGVVIGGAWAFVDAGIFGLVVAWVYNKLAK